VHQQPELLLISTGHDNHPLL
jgi:hypothetical protein